MYIINQIYFELKVLNINLINKFDFKNVLVQAESKHPDSL